VYITSTNTTSGAPDRDLDPDPAGYLVNLVDPGQIQIRLSDPDPAGCNVFGSGSDLDPAGSEVGSSKYWPDLHNYDIKHHSMFSFQEMTHNNTELYAETH